MNYMNYFHKVKSVQIYENKIDFFGTVLYNHQEIFISDKNVIIRLFVNNKLLENGERSIIYELQSSYCIRSKKNSFSYIRGYQI